MLTRATIYLASIFLLVLGVSGCGRINEQAVTVVISENAHPAEVTAAGQLCGYLERMYPEQCFEVARQPAADGLQIWAGTLASLPPLGDFVQQSEFGQSPESYLVKTVTDGKRDIGIIAGASPRAVLYGVYSLLEHLGCGFNLSGESVPAPVGESFGFARWNLADSPVVGERMVFNWHNFLSGCSAWDLEEWQGWIAQSAKMKFNTVMVHAYGNNPIFSFAHNGQKKPVGYLTTTARGRDWSTEHVNDVRRLYGGKAIFQSPVFGAKVAQVPEDQREQAASSMLRQVFEFAGQYGMNVSFALDIDTQSANPQNIIMTLPASARFRVNFKGQDFFLVNPDTPEGYAYYKSLAGSFVSCYPAVDRLVAWFRWPGGSLLRSVSQHDFPDSWKAEFRAKTENAAELSQDPENERASFFAVSKVTAALRKAFDAAGREDLALAIGTWGMDRGWFEVADLFFPADVPFIALDYHTAFDSDSVQQRIRAVGAKRPVIPVVWAHHDDRTYAGRPYTPFRNFATKLESTGAGGYGIIHWTTRPLDIFFKSLALQTWRGSKDQSLEQTTRLIAQRSFGEQNRDAIAEYLFQWVTEAPQFGRETGKRFIDHQLEQPGQVIEKCKRRLAILAGVDEAELDGQQTMRLNYYRDMERFITKLYQAQTALERSVERLENADTSNAKAEIMASHPEEVLELFASMISAAGPTRGEEGLLVSMNLRWLPYFVAQRQLLRMQAVRYNFMPTSHELLAQYRGRNTYHFDSEGKIWKGLGFEETGGEEFVIDGETIKEDSPQAEVCRTGVRSASPLIIDLKTLASGPLGDGLYTVHLLFSEPTATAAGQRVFEITLTGGGGTESAGATARSERIDIFQRLGRNNETLRVSFPVEVTAGSLELRLEPVIGKALICGVVIEPAEG